VMMYKKAECITQKYTRHISMYRNLSVAKNLKAIVSLS